MELSQEVIQMEMDLRGSEASMVDSLGIQDVQNLAAGYAGLTALVVHEALGINTGTSMAENLAGCSRTTRSSYGYRC